MRNRALSALTHTRYSFIGCSISLEHPFLRSSFRQLKHRVLIEPPERLYSENEFSLASPSKKLVSLCEPRNGYQRLRSRIEQRVFIKIAFEDGFEALETHRKLAEHYGREALSYHSVTDWRGEFRADR
jgi:hypothetical protein